MQRQFSIKLVKLFYMPEDTEVPFDETYHHRLVTSSDSFEDDWGDPRRSTYPIHSWAIVIDPDTDSFLCYKKTKPTNEICGLWVISDAVCCLPTDTAYAECYYPYRYLSEENKEFLRRFK